jgi:hypothetical protein
MSLVHEALQKAEREKQRKLGTAPSPPVSHAAPPPPTYSPVVHQPVATTFVPAVPHAPTTAATVERPAERRSFLLPALTSFCGLAAIVAIFFLVMADMRQTREQTSAPVTPVVTVPATKAAVVAVPQPTAPSTDSAAPANAPTPVTSAVDESKYKLSGIMKDPDGKPVAVVNGHVAYEGNFIDGATVKKIETDRVLIDVKGQEVVLHLF